MSDLAELNVFLTKSAKKRDQTKQSCDVAMDGLAATCIQVQSLLDGLLKQMVSAKDAMVSLKALVMEFPTQLANQLQTQEVELRGHAASLQTALEETETRLVEQMETGRVAMEDMLTDHLEQITETVNEVVEEMQERAEALFDQMKDLRSTAEDLSTELLAEALPEGVVEGADKFLSGMETLRETGLDELKKITDNVGEVQEKTKALTDLVDEVKPVLNLAEKLL